MNASKMMAKITTTNQKKNTTMPGMAYPATVLALATTASYPQPFDLFGAGTPGILVVSGQTDEAHLHAAWLGVQIWLSCASPQAKLAQASGIPIRRSGAARADNLITLRSRYGLGRVRGLVVR
jgi:hypothetical protein